ncbi:hypothetical protein [Vibrio paucivorans]
MRKIVFTLVGASLMSFNLGSYYYFELKDQGENIYSSSYTVEDLDSNYSAEVDIETYIDGGIYALLTRVKESKDENYLNAEIKTTGRFTNETHDTDIFRADDTRYLYKEKIGNARKLPIARKKTSVARKSSKLNSNIRLFEDENTISILSYRNGGQVLSYQKSELKQAY